MKPRPVLAALVVPARSYGSLQCSSRTPVRVFAPSISRNGCIPRHSIGIRCWEELGRRHAASSAAPATRKTTHIETASPQSLSKAAREKNATKGTPKPKPTTVTRPPPSPPAVIKNSPPPKHTTVPILAAKDKLNPPPISYAPEITVPARKVDQSLFSYAYKAGRAYLNFYKTGISHVRQATKLAKTLRAKAKEQPDKDRTDVLTRAEWQVVRRSRQDILRLPAFGALILILGEWLPLVVLYITPLIPEACRIPQQVSRSLRKLEDRRKDRLRKISLAAPQLMLKDKRPASAAVDLNMEDFQHNGKFLSSSAKIRNVNANTMTYFELLLFSAKYDCHARVWDWISVNPPKGLLKWSVGKTLSYLKRDDELIERDGGWAALGEKEIRRACVERGISVVGKTEEEYRKAFAGWWEDGKR